MTTRDDYIDVGLESSRFPSGRIQVHSIKGREVISQLFSFDVEFVCTAEEGLTTQQLIGADASLTFRRAGLEIRRIHGMITEMEECLDDQTEFETYRIKFVPRAHRLSFVETQEVFLDTTVPEVIRQKLLQVKLTTDDFELQLLNTYPTREFIVQYKESDLAFVSRLAEHLGISFFFDHEGDVDRIVFCDQQTIFPEIPPVLLRTRGDRRDVYELNVRSKLIPSLYVVQDYNYRIPQVELNSRHQLQSGFAGGVVEYGGHFKTPQEGDALAQIRAEERQVEARVYSGESDVVAFSAGRRVHLEGRTPLDLLIVSVEHEASRPVLTHGGDGTEWHYHNRFQAIPVEHTFRPRRVTPKPRIDGLLPGIIEHSIQEGVERWSQIEEQGRYTVRFFFDTAEHSSKQSRQIRMLQPHVGTNYGMHFPLKPGVEVMIGFVNGDPDRPIIVGGAYRPDTPSPITSANHKQNTIKSESGVVLVMRDA